MCVCVGGGGGGGWGREKKAEPPSLVNVAPPLVVCIRFLIPRRRLLRTSTCMQLEFLYFCYFTCDRFLSSCLASYIKIRVPVYLTYSYTHLQYT